MAAVKQVMTNYTGHSVWTGLELINSSASINDSNSWGYYYRNGTFFSQTYLPWASGQPTTSPDRKRALYSPSINGTFNAPETNNAYYYTCEYEEALKHPVTDLEQKCVALPGSLFAWFVNDVCYTVHRENKSYSDAKLSCNDLSGYNGHLAHVSTMGELWIADGMRSVSCILIR
uniref:C-type lectin domain-containing protein n=1 Tax=Plectus sambesii TaxID=2011161 RepID=A0A914WZ68_9BILA